MGAPKASIIDGMKFMWDGKEYASKEAARESAKEYEDRGFTIRVVEEDGQPHIYTRRVVTEIPLEGSEPI